MQKGMNQHEGRECDEMSRLGKRGDVFERPIIEETDRDHQHPVKRAVLLEAFVEDGSGLRVAIHKISTLIIANLCGMCIVQSDNVRTDNAICLNGQWQAGAFCLQWVKPLPFEEAE